jgi:DNA-binding transcriptional ArsR family regulator
MLGDRPRSVSELALELPISRPAVSWHLRLLKEAGLVAEERRGTRRIYELREAGLDAVRAYLEALWGDAAARFRLMAENTRRTKSRRHDD